MASPIRLLTDLIASIDLSPIFPWNGAAPHPFPHMPTNRPYLYALVSLPEEAGFPPEIAHNLPSGTTISPLDSLPPRKRPCSSKEGVAWTRIWMGISLG